MAVSVKKVTIWTTEVPHQAGQLANVLRPLAEAGANLQVIMAYAEGSRGFVEVCPLSGKRHTEAARRAGLVASDKPTLLVAGDDRPGLGYAIARAIADRGVSISFDVTQVMGKKFSSVYGFHTEEDARAAAGAIKKAGAGRKS
jgi:hypothetical protein